MKKIPKNKGFTLIEILVVIGIIAILATIVLIAINPARQFAQANNTQRTSNVNAILNAIGQYMADNKGARPAGIVDGADTAISTAGTALAFCTAIVPTYMTALPTDPTATAFVDCTAYSTGYTVNRDAASGRITVKAPSAELGATISVQR